MSQTDYHDAVVEAANEAIESGAYLLREGGVSSQRVVINTPSRSRTLADLLREAEQRGLGPSVSPKNQSNRAMELSIHQLRFKRVKSVARYGSRAAKVFIRRHGDKTVVELLAMLKSRDYRFSA